MARYIRPKQLEADYGIDRATAWKWSCDGQHHFPKPIRLSVKLSVYDVEQVETWIKAHDVSSKV